MNLNDKHNAERLKYYNIEIIICRNQRVGFFFFCSVYLNVPKTLLLLY